MTSDPAPRPVICPPQSVLAEWIDYNSHMNLAYYVLAFDRALDHVLDILEIGQQYVERGEGSCFVLQNHLHYLHELTQGEIFSTEFQMIDFDSKRIHYFLSMRRDSNGTIVATTEQITLHIDLKTRRPTKLPAAALRRLKTMLESHRQLPRPRQLGAAIGIRHRS